MVQENPEVIIPTVVLMNSKQIVGAYVNAVRVHKSLPELLQAKEQFNKVYVDLHFFQQQLREVYQGLDLPDKQHESVVDAFIKTQIRK